MIAARFDNRLKAACAAAAAVAVMLPSCAFNGLAFRQDDRVKIVAPRDRAVVVPPFTLKWTVEDFTFGPGTVASGNNYFAVFIDRQPMPPGEHLRALGDDACKLQPGCPDETWLSQHRVFVADDTEITITSLPDLLPRNSRAGVKENHDIVIVLMDGSDRRIGEYAYYIELFRTIRGFR